MGRFDYEQARLYALHRLGEFLPPKLYYHSLVHTRDDVTPAAERLARMERIEGDELLLVLTGALYHDLGFTFLSSADGDYSTRGSIHEELSAEIASHELMDFGYSEGDVRVVCGMIMATKLPQSPKTLLEQIVADADLDSLGRTDFWRINDALRAEHAAFGKTYTDEEWHQRQLRFLESHHYFTASARLLRETKKQESMAHMRLLLSRNGHGSSD